MINKKLCLLHDRLDKHELVGDLVSIRVGTRGGEPYLWDLNLKMCSCGKVYGITNGRFRYETVHTWMTITNILESNDIPAYMMENLHEQYCMYQNNELFTGDLSDVH